MEDSQYRNNGSVAIRRVNDIFFCMLRRKAGVRGLYYLQWLCGNRVGAIFAIFILALTPESRMYGKTWERIKKPCLM